MGSVYGLIGHLLQATNPSFTPPPAKLRQPQLSQILDIINFSLRLLGAQSVYHRRIANNPAQDEEIFTSLERCCANLYTALSQVLKVLPLELSHASEVFEALRGCAKFYKHSQPLKVSGSRGFFHLCKNVFLARPEKCFRLLVKMLEFSLKQMVEYSSSLDRKYLVKAANYVFNCLPKYQSKFEDFVQSRLTTEGLSKSMFMV